VGSRAEFDRYADDYDASLAAALEATGEDRGFYAQGRVAWLARCLRQLNFKPSRVLDYGCGDGSTSPILCKEFGLERCVGLDVSSRSIEMARSRFASDQCQFFEMGRYAPDGSLDLAYCNGVFHHIPLDARPSAAGHVFRSLRPGGIFALWENSAWNPGTRYVMARCAFDKDAVTLTPRQTRRLLQSPGFKILRTDFAFVFPHFLKAFRPLEKWISKLPLGAQYQVLAQKPDTIE
jgi:SAM-dependent methyltransferase